jgi:hypothetical protein
MSGPWEDFASSANDSGPWNDFAPSKSEQSEPVQAKTWSDVPMAALQNAPTSAVEFGKNLAQPFLHPITTAENIGALGKGLYSKAKGALGYEQNPDEKAQVEAPADAVGEFFKQRYGGLENLKKTMSEDPIGFLGDAATVLTGGELAAGRVPGIVGETARAAGTVGSAIDPIANAGRVASGVVDFAGNRAANALGITTGAGTDAIKTAYQAGRNGNDAFLNGISGNAKAKDVVDAANSGFSNIAQQRGQNYQGNIAGLGAPTSPLDFTPIQKAIDDSKNVFTQGNFVKDPAAQATLDSIETKTLDWMLKNPNPTPLDYDALKQSIGVIRDSTSPGTRSFKVADDVYNSIANEIGGKVPGYTDAMNAYAEASNNLQQLKQTMSLKGPKTNVDTAARKLLSGLRDNVNTNFGQRKALLDQLNQQNPDLIPTLAGMTLSSPTPRGLAAHVASGEAMLAALHNPALLLGLPLTSPKLVGYGAYGAGRAAGAAQPLTNLAPSAKMLGLLQQAGRVNNQIPGLLGQ